MKGAESLAIIPIVLVVAGLLIYFKAKWSRSLMEKYLVENGIDATVEKAGIPPLRLWLKNRKGDSWCRLRYTDGSARWARIRSTFGGRRIELFD